MDSSQVRKGQTTSCISTLVPKNAVNVCVARSAFLLIERMITDCRGQNGNLGYGKDQPAGEISVHVVTEYRRQDKQETANN